MRPDVGAAEDAAAIRVATVADAAAIAAIYAPYVTDTPISFEEVPPDAAEIARRMTSDPVLPWLVAPVDHGASGRDRIVGYAYASRHRPRAAYRWAVDCTAYVTADHQRAGLVRRLYAALFDELRNLFYTKVFAGITLPNAASVGLHEALGFSQLGIFRRVGYQGGSWYDVGWWQLPLLPPPADTPDRPPVSDSPERQPDAAEVPERQPAPAEPRPWQPS